MQNAAASHRRPVFTRLYSTKQGAPDDPDKPPSVASLSESTKELTTPEDSKANAIDIEMNKLGFAVSKAEIGENVGASPYRGEQQAWAQVG